MKESEVIYASWCLSDNFGDKLTPYLVEKISGKKCIWSPPDSDILKYVVTGSILNWEIKNAIAWGAGIAGKDDHINIEKIVATRGEISKYFSILKGIENEIAVGDPALLLPRLYTPKVKKRYKLGIFPHYIDSDIITYNLLSQLPEDVVMIYALDDIEETIDLICSCDRIMIIGCIGFVKVKHWFYSFIIPILLGFFIPHNN